MKPSHITVIAMLLLACGIAAAQPVIKFEEQNFNFGIFDEELEKVHHTFTFINTGNEPLVIKNVRSTCGCAATEYTQRPIPPKGKGEVTVTYHATGRPGGFSKAVYVYTNGSPSRSILRITGEVVQGNHPQSSQYAYRIGDLKLKTLHMPLSKVVKGKTSSGFIEMINTSQDTLSPQVETEARHIRARVVPDTLLPGEEGSLVITYDPDAVDDWGYRRDELHLSGVTADGRALSEAEYNTITVSATVTEDFDSMTAEEKALAPVMAVGKKIVDFGIIKGEKKASCIIYIANIGYSPLIIHKVRNENEVITAKTQKRVLKPGQTTRLVIEVNPRRAHSNLLLSDIYIISNDPGNTSQQIRITAEFQ